MVVITFMPFRGLHVDNTAKAIVAGPSVYSVFMPENIDGFIHKSKKHKKRKPYIDTIVMVNDVPNSRIKFLADSICRAVGVPNALVREIGENESRWTFIRSKSGGPGKGDLQVIDNTFAYWYKRLGLKGGHTRSNYLVVSVNYLKYCYNQEKSWRKARFVYARGTWRDESTWTPMERAFMNKIDWSKYDKY